MRIITALILLACIEQSYAFVVPGYVPKPSASTAADCKFRYDRHDTVVYAANRITQHDVHSDPGTKHGVVPTAERKAHHNCWLSTAFAGRVRIPIYHNLCCPLSLPLGGRPSFLLRYKCSLYMRNGEDRWTLDRMSIIL